MINGRAGILHGMGSIFLSVLDMEKLSGMSE